MTINLSSYRNIGTALLCKWVVPSYYDSTTSNTSSQTFTISNCNFPVVYSGSTYQPLGELISITETSSDIRISPGEISIVLSGINTNKIKDILQSQIKGTNIYVWRAIFNPDNGQLLSISGNPAGRFQGIVNNYTIEEDYEPGSINYSNRIVLQCSNTVTSLNNKVSGRRTNPSDQKALYASDLSMDRVLNLANSNFNFGAVIK